MRDNTERGRDIGRGEAGSLQEARCRTRSWDSRIVHWAKGRRQTAEPRRDPLCGRFKQIELSLLWPFRGRAFPPALCEWITGCEGPWMLISWLSGYSEPGCVSCDHEQLSLFTPVYCTNIMICGHLVMQNVG